MKRVRCPKCDNFITFDETKYQAGQSLVFVCPNCNKQFGIRMGVSKLRETRKEEKLDENANEKGYGSIVVIENVFAYKHLIQHRRQEQTPYTRTSKETIGYAAKPHFTHITLIPENIIRKQNTYIIFKCNDSL